MNEYELLRAEIVSELSTMRSYEIGMYSVVAAILAFTVNSNHYLACMLPYVVIISSFFVVLSIRISIYRMGTYLDVFHEGGQYNWERRHAEFDKGFVDTKHKSLRVTTRTPYYFLSLSCSIVTGFKLLMNKHYTYGYKLLIVLLITLFTIFILFMFYRTTKRYINMKSEMVTRWREIKNGQDIAKMRGHFRCPIENVSENEFKPVDGEEETCSKSEC